MAGHIHRLILRLARDGFGPSASVRCWPLRRCAVRPSPSVLAVPPRELPSDSASHRPATPGRGHNRSARIPVHISSVVVLVHEATKGTPRASWNLEPEMEQCDL